MKIQLIVNLKKLDLIKDSMLFKTIRQTYSFSQFVLQFAHTQLIVPNF